MYRIVNLDTNETIYEGNNIREAIIAYSRCTHAIFYTGDQEDMRK